MAANLDAAHGVALAEAASVALARHMPRPEAQALVKAASRDAVASGRHLLAVLPEHTDAPVDWQALAAPENTTGAAGTFVDRALAAGPKPAGRDPGRLERP